MTLENSQIVLIHPIVLYGHVGKVFDGCQETCFWLVKGVDPGFVGLEA